LLSNIFLVFGIFSIKILKWLEIFWSDIRTITNIRVNSLIGAQNQCSLHKRIFVCFGVLTPRACSKEMIRYKAPIIFLIFIQNTPGTVVCPTFIIPTNRTLE